MTKGSQDLKWVWFCKVGVARAKHFQLALFDQEFEASRPGGVQDSVPVRAFQACRRAGLGRPSGVGGARPAASSSWLREGSRPSRFLRARLRAPR